MLRTVITIAAVLLTAVPAAVAAAGDTDPNANWPCVQHKVVSLTSAQMWDGPAVDTINDWWKDEEVRKLVPVLVSRRVEMDKVEEAIDAFAKAIPEGSERDRRLTLLFAGALEETNKVRKQIIAGIERFQDRQQARARRLEEQGIELAELHKRAEKDRAAATAVDQAQEAYDWNARVFNERQESLPLACEIPQLIESRIFAVAQAIRARMS
ncbi:MAG: hypothetical protein NW217_11315 [Hyphomicrobiaceae bacterium]|nr:hypothetical protein [Hyphomicrobiaceae bacterium]